VRAGLAHARQNNKRLGAATAALRADRVRKLCHSGLSKSAICPRLHIGHHLGAPYPGNSVHAEIARTLNYLALPKNSKGCCASCIIANPEATQGILADWS